MKTFLEVIDVTVSAHDVARELRARIARVGDVKVHKLLYYCQGWHLAWTGDRLFVEDIQAWTNGPVVADLWHAETKKREIPPAATLSPVDRSTLDFVVETYGRYSGQTLIQRTHAEAPWKNVSEDAFAPSNPVITDDALIAFFASEIGDREELGRAAINDPRVLGLISKSIGDRHNGKEPTPDTREAILDRIRLASA
jgi:uncharacterized phage-associated protein